MPQQTCWPGVRESKFLSAVVSGEQGSDPAAVAFDAAQAAVARKADIVFIDTAGRMHTKQTLMVELEKVKRSVAKALPGAPHETWMVIDATTGNNALAQARAFHEAIGLSGLVVSKLDGSARAGAIVGVRKETGVPVVFAGLGEGMDDLSAFSAEAFVRAMLEEPAV